MKVFTSYFAFFICIVGIVATGYGMITHGLKDETTQAYTCSCNCALYKVNLYGINASM